MNMTTLRPSLALLFATSFAAIGAKADSIGYSGAIVDFTVLNSGTYDISVAYAQGGSVTDTSSVGGLGALLDGDVFLAPRAHNLQL